LQGRQAVEQSVSFLEKLNTTFHPDSYFEYLFAPNKKQDDKLVPLVIQKRHDIQEIKTKSFRKC
jgi:hypothetical protein